jgi:hypothetical protein
MTLAMKNPISIWSFSIISSIGKKKDKSKPMRDWLMKKRREEDKEIT